MKVSIFSTCVMDLMFPQVGIAMVEVLERLGIETDLPEGQICCGQPTYNSGLVKEYPHMFDEGDPYKQKAIDLANKSYEFTQFIYRVLGLEDLGATFNGEKATYHRSCHMTRILGEREAPFILLDKVKGLEVLPLPHLENCCGFGGTFSVKSPEISEMMVTEKTNDILSTGAEILISADLGCLMNIAGKLNREGKKIRVMHIAEILNTNVDLERIDTVKNPEFIRA